MQSNPIQRKTRNAFLSGMLIMLLMAVAIGVVLYFTVLSDMLGATGTTGKGGTVYAYRLIANVKSGDKIEANKLEKVKLYVSDLPADYVKDNENVTGYKSKLDLKKGTILSTSLLYENEKITDSTRLVELNMLTLPSTLRVGDYIDVRFTIPSGQNYIVVAKKQVMGLNNSTVTLYLSEDEILMMSCAIIESYIMKASNLSVIQYVEGGMQKSSTPTYPINAEVYELVLKNKEKNINIEDYTKITDSIDRSDDATNLRQIIEQELGEYIGTEEPNIQEGITKEKETAMELYLSGLQGY